MAPWLAIAALLILAMAPTNAGARAKPRPLFWGAVIGSQLTGEAAPWDMNAVYKFQRHAHKGISLLAFSSPFADCITTPCTQFPFPTTAMEGLRRNGTVPFLTWASQSVPSSLDQPGYGLSTVASGGHDAYIREFAEQAKDWGHPFFLRFDPEMNGFWFPWSEGVNGNRPGEFVAAWRHVHDIFTSVGATNATWVWCPNIDFNRKLTSLRRLYPGNHYVDWTCVDGFNWGNTRISAGWMSFEQVFRSTYKRISKIAPRKPMVIGEVASEERGGSKPRWIRNMLNVIPTRYRKVRGVIWFDEKDQGMNWPIESSRRSTRAFAHAIRGNLYRPNVFSWLPNDRPIAPPGNN